MKILLTVLILGVAIALAYSNSKGYNKYANLFLIALIAFTALFMVFGFVGSLGVTYPEYIYEIEQP